MTTPRSPRAGWFGARTRLVTVFSIVAVGVAGASAVSANLGILDSASDSPVGDATATSAGGTPSTQVVDVFLPETAPTTSAPSDDPAVQEFAVDVAGTVSVALTSSGIRLDEVEPAAGWSWTLAQTDPRTLTVVMTDGNRTFEFTATVAPDGTISATVSEPIVVTAPPGTTPATGTQAGGSHGQGDHDDEDDDDHEDEDHEDEDHKDEHEYEGGEDDD